MPIAQLRTRRLTLRQICAEDAPFLHEQFGLDDQMHTYTGWNPYATLEQARATVQTQVEECESGLSYCWAVETDDELVGTVSAYELDPAQSKIEVGVSIIRSAWGRGFATEALACALAYLAEQEGIRHIVAWAASENIGSLKALTKTGMQQTSVEKNALRVGDQTFDKVWFEYQR